MRDPERIPEVLVKLETLWNQVPQLRLGQLIWVLNNNKDPFYVEDDMLLNEIERWMDTDEASRHYIPPSPRSKK